jgi:hypothetical protein
MTDPTFIVWLDPGKTTGLAWYDIDADRFGSSQHGEDELMQVVSSLIDVHYPRIAIGWEMYLRTPRSKGIADYSVGGIAKVRALCQQERVPVLKAQPSSARNLQSTVIFLRRLGWYRPGLGHANDAAAHLFRHLIKQHPVPENIRKRLPAGY